jgi:hypothetical protein
MAVDDPSNPWSRSGWNVTAQGDYYKRMGKLGAERKAQEAGTFLGGPKPPPPGGDPKPEIFQRNFIMHQRRSAASSPVADAIVGTSGNGPPDSTTEGGIYIDNVNDDFYLHETGVYNKKGQLVRTHVLGLMSEAAFPFTSFQYFELGVGKTSEHYFNGLSDVMSSVSCVFPTAASCDLVLTDDLAAFLARGDGVLATAHFEGVTKDATLNFADRVIPAHAPLWLVMPEVPDLAMAGLRCLFVSEQG